MSQTLTLKPAEGRRVRDPADNQPLPEEGRPVTQDAYWTRRLLDGDVEIVPALAGKAPKKTED